MQKSFLPTGRSTQKKLRSSFALLLALLMAVSVLPALAVGVVPTDPPEQAVGTVVEITEEQMAALEAIQEFNELVGLVGFDDDFILPDDDTQVPVLVFFEANPAPTQVMEAALYGRHLPLAMAEEIVEDNHSAFQRELSDLFGGSRIRAFGFGATDPEYHITIEYRHAFNGVAMTLPANMVHAVAELGMVQAIFPDFVVAPPEIMENYDYEPVDGEYVFFPQVEQVEPPFAGNPWGNSQGRRRMNADELHRRGIDGAGVIVAVIDTGIDWMHPSFAGSFPPAEVINQARIDRFGPNGTAGHRPELTRPLWDGTNNPYGYNELFNINRYTQGHRDILGRERAEGDPEYVFLGRDTMRLWPGGQGNDPRGNPLQRGGSPGFSGSPATWTYQVPLPPGMPGNNPMECSPLYFWDDNGQNMRIAARYNLVEAGPTVGIPGASWHGTHVAGTILARPYPAPDHPNFNPATAVMGVAPGAWGIHYRGLYGHAGGVYGSVWISAQEWAFLDGANVVNMSLGAQLASAISVMNHSVNNIMLADPTIVFTISAGNSGNAFFTGGSPGGSIMAITVSALTEPAPTLRFESPTADTNVVVNFMVANVASSIDPSTVPGNVIFRHPANTAHDNGTMTIFTLPVEYPVTYTPAAGLAGLAIGGGTRAEFEALVEIHGAEALRGNFVLARRGFTFVDLSNFAREFGLGGVIQINGQGQAVASGGTNAVPMLSMPFAAGTAFANAILQAEYATDRYATFEITEWIANQAVQGFSSRGPLETSFTISPDIGSHGVNVTSTDARATAAGGAAMGNWTWQNTAWTATRTASGTSMSAPHLGGAVALLQQYSRQNAEGGMWSNYEIKTRIMNTAIFVPGATLGPFDAGRNVDVLAAVETNTVVFAEYTRVPTDLWVQYDSPAQNFATTFTGSFSFGGFNRHPGLAGTSPRNIGDGAGSYTMRAFIDNNSDEAITYTLRHRFMAPGRAARPAGTPTAPLAGATLVHPETITVLPGQRATFDVTINLPANNQLGFHYGFLYVEGGSRDIVMPFAAVTHSRLPAFTFGGLYRPVITTNTIEQGAQNITSNELVMYFQQGWGFYAVFYLIDGAAVESGMTPENWLRSTVDPNGSHVFDFEEYFLGTTMRSAEDYRGRWGRHFPRNRGGGINPDQIMRGVIFDGYYTPGMWEHPGGVDMANPVRLDREGDFFIGISIFRQSPNAVLPGGGLVGNHIFWAWEQAVLVPFSVDNTPPEFTSVAVNGVNIDLNPDEPMALAFTCDEGLVRVEGNVQDVWLSQAIADGVTFDVWLENGEVSMDNLALWVTSDPIGGLSRLNIDEYGDFMFYYDTMGLGAAEISFWLIDGYAPVPLVNQHPIGVGDPFITGGPAAANNWWNRPAAARTLTAQTNFTPNGLLAYTNPGLRSDVVFARHTTNPLVNNIPIANFDLFGMAGLNVTELTITLVVEVDVNFVRVHETSRGSRDWNINFAVEKILPSGDILTTIQNIVVPGPNANVNGVYTFGAGHLLEGFSLVIDIRNNGANVVTFALR